MRRPTTAALASALALGLAAPPRAAAQAPPTSAPPAADPRTVYTGSYRYAGGDRERNDLNAAVERATYGMVFFVRPIANSRIRDANPVPGAVTIRFPPGQIEVLAVANRAWRSPANGAPAPSLGVHGDAVTLTSRWENGHLVQVISNGQGARRNDYVLSADGRTLTLRVTITSDRLPRPVRYELTYRR
jgi:hypothetical protein